MTLLAKVIAGSKLYGLDNPNSDTDIKSIFLPPLRDCLLMRASRNEHSKDEVSKTEHEGFALQSFLNLASSAEDVAIVMLHADDRMVLSTSETFQTLR